MDNATNNDTLMSALSSSKLLLYYYYYYYTDYYTKAFHIIMTLLNIEYAALAISLTL